MWYARSATSSWAAAARGLAADFFAELAAFFAPVAFFAPPDFLTPPDFFADVDFFAAFFFPGPSDVDISPSCLDSQYLFHGQSPDFELCLVRLPGPHCALQLVPWPTQRARQHRTRVPLGPPKALYRHGHASKRNRAVDRRTLQPRL